MFRPERGRRVIVRGCLWVCLASAHPVCVVLYILVLVLELVLVLVLVLASAHPASVLYILVLVPLPTLPAQLYFYNTLARLCRPKSIYIEF